MTIRGRVTTTRHIPATNVQYTLYIEPVGDHLQVTIAEIGVTVETVLGKIKREDAERAATRAISEYVLAQTATCAQPHFLFILEPDNSFFVAS